MEYDSWYEQPRGHGLRPPSPTAQSIRHSPVGPPQSVDSGQSVAHHRSFSLEEIKILTRKKCISCFCVDFRFKMTIFEKTSILV